MLTVAGSVIAAVGAVVAAVATCLRLYWDGVDRRAEAKLRESELALKVREERARKLERLREVERRREKEAENRRLPTYQPHEVNQFVRRSQEPGSPRPVRPRRSGYGKALPHRTAAEMELGRLEGELWRRQGRHHRYYWVMRRWSRRILIVGLALLTAGVILHQTGWLFG